jgi:periplasmic copper chaperone A
VRPRGVWHNCAARKPRAHVPGEDFRAVSPLRALPGVCLVAALAAAVSAAPPALVVEDAWIRAIPGSAVAAAYMTLHNTGSAPVTVSGVRSALAADAMIHVSKVEHGESTMRPAGPLTLAPGASLALAPGGVHVMLMQLAHPFAVGEQVPLELLLAGGGRVAVSARVRPLEPE